MGQYTDYEAGAILNTFGPEDIKLKYVQNSYEHISTMIHVLELLVQHQENVQSALAPGVRSKIDNAPLLHARSAVENLQVVLKETNEAIKIAADEYNHTESHILTHEELLEKEAEELRKLHENEIN